jgi:hypothetical protein
MTSLFSSSVFAEPVFTVYNSTGCPSDGIIPHNVMDGCTPITGGFWSISVQSGLESGAFATVLSGYCQGNLVATLTEDNKCYNMDAVAGGVAYAF